jgi:hypothetical protein
VTWREYGGSGCLPCGYPLLMSPAWGRSTPERAFTFPLNGKEGCGPRALSLYMGNVT